MRANRAFCLRHGIRLSGPRLGRPKSDPELAAEAKRQFAHGQRQRNAVEGKIGQGKRRYGLGLIRKKLAVTQGSVIALDVLVMNLEKLLGILFVLFTTLLSLCLLMEPVEVLRLRAQPDSVISHSGLAHFLRRPYGVHGEEGKVGGFIGLVRALAPIGRPDLGVVGSSQCR
jgi:hypothetical protein